MKNIYDYINVRDTREYIRKIDVLAEKNNVWNYEMLILDIEKNIILKDYIKIFIDSCKTNIKLMNYYENTNNWKKINEINNENNKIWNICCKHGLVDSLNNNNNFEILKTDILKIKRTINLFYEKLNILKYNNENIKIEKLIILINKEIFKLKSYICLIVNFYSIYKPFMNIYIMSNNEYNNWKNKLDLIENTLTINNNLYNYIFYLYGIVNYEIRNIFKIKVIIEDINEDKYINYNFYKDETQILNINGTVQKIPTNIVIIDIPKNKNEFIPPGGYLLSISDRNIKNNNCNMKYKINKVYNNNNIRYNMIRYLFKMFNYTIKKIWNKYDTIGFLRIKKYIDFNKIKYNNFDIKDKWKWKIIFIKNEIINIMV